jgi:hypothetical protein
MILTIFPGHPLPTNMGQAQRPRTQAFIQHTQIPRRAEAGQTRPHHRIDRKALRRRGRERPDSRPRRPKHVRFHPEPRQERDT